MNNKIVRGMNKIWKNGLYGTIKKYNEKKETQKILLGSQEKIVRHTEYRKKTEAPLEKDTVLGKVQFLLNGEVLQEKKILAKSSVKQRKMKNWLVWTLQRFLF